MHSGKLWYVRHTSITGTLVCASGIHLLQSFYSLKGSLGMRR